MNGPDRDTQCRHLGCPAKAGYTGFCYPHRRLAYNARTQATSDGRSTGNKPKLTPEDVAEARRMYAAFKTRREIAAHFGVSLSTLRNYMAGQS